MKAYCIHKHLYNNEMHPIISVLSEEEFKNSNIGEYDHTILESKDEYASYQNRFIYFDNNDKREKYHQIIDGKYFKKGDIVIFSNIESITNAFNGNPILWEIHKIKKDKHNSKKDLIWVKRFILKKSYNNIKKYKKISKKTNRSKIEIYKYFLEFLE